MYVRLTTSKKSKHPTMQIVEGVREGKKVRQRIVASLGIIKSKNDLVKLSKLADNLIQKLELQGLPIESKVRLSDLIHNNTIYDGFGIVVDKLLPLTGFLEVISKAQGRNKFDLKEIVKLIIVQRLHLPSSKLRTYERQEEHGFHNIDLQHIYRTMDAIESFSYDFQLQAFETVRKYVKGDLDCFFFDVTTLYFESVKQDDIRDFGFSKDQKHHSVQIVLALIVDSRGIPLAYETFKGNLAETKTLIPVLESLRTRFEIKNVIVVCDRGLASKTNVIALQEAQFHFVIATKLRSISKKIQINNLSTYTVLTGQEDIPEENKIRFRTMEHPQYKDTLLIATYSPARAVKDREDRERLLRKLREKIGNGSDESSVKRVISNSGYKKFTNVGTGSQITLNDEAIAEDASWDGFHGIAVSNSAKLSVVEALARYRDLWHVEEAFRVTKSSLKTRPIFHWKPHRIKTHVLLCFLTLFFERFLELLLQQQGTPLTPDRIRYALSGVHTMLFTDINNNKLIGMQSSISEDAEKIFKVLNIPTNRLMGTNDCCV